MYTQHPIFEKPQDENVKLWRYQNIAKLVSLLDTKSLFFARVDVLEDQFEGALPHPNIAMRHASLKPILNSSPEIYQYFEDQTGQKLSAEQASAIAQGSFAYIDRHLSKENRALRRYTCVSCWHINEEESAAMWKLYCQSNEAVSVQSTFARLARSLNGFQRDIFIGTVKYSNYENESIPEGNDLHRFMHKRKSFQHERELRALYREEPIITRADGSKDIDHSIELFPGGANIPVDVEALVERIVVAPTAPQWFYKVVESVVRKFGFQIPVAPSSLNATPYF